MVLNWKKVFCGLFAGLALSAAAGEVRFRDGGFESYRKQTGDLYWWRLVSPESGSALADKEKHSGRYSLKIVPSGNEARVKYLRGIFKTHPGRVYTLCVWAKGSASLGAEVQFRREIPGQPGGWARKMPVMLFWQRNKHPPFLPHPGIRHPQSRSVCNSQRPHRLFR